MSLFFVALRESPLFFSRHPGRVKGVNTSSEWFKGGNERTSSNRLKRRKDTEEYIDGHNNNKAVNDKDNNKSNRTFSTKALVPILFAG